jgi:hypothetical protein
MPTAEQQRLLYEMLHRAFLEIRILGWEGKAFQAADLADAFHNLPLYMISENFNWEIFRSYLESYQRKYPRAPISEFDYLALLEKIKRD